jgi:hypothetical protein
MLFARETMVLLSKELTVVGVILSSRLKRQDGTGARWTTLRNFLMTRATKTK